MTLSSMTGFARASAETPQGALAWELKTVNAKGLDLRLKIPGRLDAEDARFRTRLAAVLNRGTVQATLTLQRPPRPVAVRVNTAALRALIAAIMEAVPPDLPVAPVSFDGLIAVPGVLETVEPAESEADHDMLRQAAAGLLDQALEDLQNVRAAEGKALSAVLNAQLDRIASLTEAADCAPGRSPEAVRAKLERAIALLAGQTPPLDPIRLHQEAVMLATRADIREEIDRLRVHRRAASALLEQGGVVGRKLDFLAQEFGREANTLCAKSNDPSLTTIGLDLRNTIEQFREQVQNLE